MIHTKPFSSYNKDDEIYRRVSFSGQGESDKNIQPPLQTRTFLLEKVEEILMKIGRNDFESRKTAVPVEDVISELQRELVNDGNIVGVKELCDCLEEVFRDGGSLDYNKLDYYNYNTISSNMWTRGKWKYDVWGRTLWLWSWGDVHPYQCCAHCGSQESLGICTGCRYSRGAKAYCSIACQRADWPAHQSWCMHFQKYGPALASSAGEITRAHSSCSETNDSW